VSSAPLVRLLRSPLTLFLAVSVALVVGIFLATSELADRTARDVSLEQAESITELLADSTIPGNLRVGLLKGRPGSVDKFVRRLQGFDTDAIDSFDILRSDGFLAFDSRNPGAAGDGEVYPLTEGQQEVLRSGGTVSSVADPESRRSADRPGDEAGLVKISTYVEATVGDKKQDLLERRKEPLPVEPALFVAYWELEGVEARQSELFSSFRWITLGPLLLLVGISTLMLGLLNGQVRRGSRDRERLLQTAIDASDAERRRIARDLHDGVVQDLAGSGFALSGAARDPDTTPQTAAVLDAVGASLRDSLKQMRSLLAEIHPPDLHGQGLQAALDDLIAPAAAAGIHASTSVAGVENASGPEVALVWRVAQEAVRNATRHSGASTLAVTVRADEEQLLLEVVDDGVGFDTTAPSEPDRFGLRGLRSLVRDVGGELKVDSAVGEGTSVRMAVRR
jgi:signal transduction histidine kinase